MSNKKLEDLEIWGIELLECKLPRWEELPAIDLYMDQLVSIVETYIGPYASHNGGKSITSSIINNYVKLKIIPPPVKRKYSKKHIAHIIMICIMKPTVPISSIKLLIELQLRIYPIDILFNQFCSTFEDITKKTLINAEKESFSEIDQEDLQMQNFAMKMAIQSNASKILTDKIFAAQEIKADSSKSKKKS